MLSASAVVTIGVLGLFHPTELRVRPANSEPLKIQAGDSTYTLEGNRTLTFHLGQIRTVQVASLSDGPGQFILIVPGKIERQYRGLLEIRSTQKELLAVVSMDLESAVASAVAAESEPGAAAEALKSQAVASRSFYIAAQHRHALFDFCDTTHCQFLRQIPAPASNAFLATEATRGLVLTYRGSVLAAQYSAACGGHTRSLDNAGPNHYPYFAVDCAYCLRQTGTRVRGHRLGLCQQGAAGMAADGMTFRAILNHYYPATAVSDWDTGTSQTPSKLTKKQSTFILGKTVCR